MGWAGQVTRVRGKRNAYGALVEKPESKRPLGRSKLRWKHNIKMYLQETLCEGVKLIHLVQDRENGGNS
jgi:hypothetical protein